SLEEGNVVVLGAEGQEGGAAFPVQHHFHPQRLGIEMHRRLDVLHAEHYVSDLVDSGHVSLLCDCVGRANAVRFFIDFTILHARLPVPNPKTPVRSCPFPPASSPSEYRHGSTSVTKQYGMLRYMSNI